MNDCKIELQHAGSGESRKIELEPPCLISVVELSSDGSRMAVVQELRDGIARLSVWDAANARSLFAKDTDPVEKLAISRQRVAFRSFRGVLRVWSHGGEARWETQVGEESWLRFDSRGRLWGNDAHNRVVRWADSGKKSHEGASEWMFTTDIAVRRDDRVVTEELESWSVWDGRTRLSHPNDAVAVWGRFWFDDGGKTIVTMRQRWSVETGALIERIDEHAHDSEARVSNVRDAAARQRWRDLSKQRSVSLWPSDDGRFAVDTTTSTIDIIDSRGRTVHRHPANASHVAFDALSPTGRWVVVTPASGKLAAYDWRKRRTTKLPDGESRNNAFIGESEYAMPTKAEITIMSLATGKRVRGLEPGCEGSLELDRSPDGRLVALICREGEYVVRFYRTSDWRRITPTRPVRDAMYLKFSPDGSHLAVATKPPDSIVVWSLSSMGLRTATSRVVDPRLASARRRP